jgi:hypothetical protein
MLTRRQFAMGAAAMTSAGIIGWRIAESRASHFNTPLPIPRLIDAAKQGNAVSLTIAAGRHAFVEGKRLGHTDTRRLSLDRSFACAAAIESR